MSIDDLKNYLSSFQTLERIADFYKEETINTERLLKFTTQNKTKGVIYLYLDDLKTRIKGVFDKKNRIINLINSMNDKSLSEILKDRYINGYSLEQLDEKYGYSVRQISRIQEKALLQMLHIVEVDEI